MGFQVKLPERLMTRREFLFMLGSVYDPLGPAGPFILEGRSIIEKLCKGSATWHERIPRGVGRQWVKWVHRLLGLVSIDTPR